jgi:predicted transcriptional regulator
MSMDVLELETRRDLYDLVRRMPGLHMREIQRQMDLSIALTEYHLRQLENAGLIASVTEEGYRRYYPAREGADGSVAGLTGAERRMVAVLRQPIPLRVALFLMGRPSANHTEIGGSLGLSPSKLSFHMRKLVGAGVVRKLPRSEGRGYAISDRERVLRLLIAYRPTPDLLDDVQELWEALDL